MYIKIDNSNKVQTILYGNEPKTTDWIEVESIPAFEEIEGKVAVTYYSADKGFWVEYEDLPTIEPTPVDTSVEINAEIEDLKQKLADTDYEAIKYAEGWINAEDYAELKAQRQAWRDRINELQARV